MSFRRWLVKIGAFCWCGAASPLLLRAQVGAYQRAPGDTTRYRETTKIDGSIRGAAGDVPITLSREASIAVTFAGGDSVRAWYESLAVETSGPRGSQRAASESLLRAPFVLKMDARGRVETLRAPDFPASLRQLEELSPEFEDFFPKLPGTLLAAGTEWADTSARVKTDPQGRRISIRRIGRYRLERDTTIAGEPAGVLSIHVDFKVESSSPLQRQPYTVELALTGTEDGSAVFSFGQGRLVNRDRSGDAKGTITYKGGETPVVVDQSYKYRSTIDAVDPWRTKP